jgi:hypothetical protein
MGNKVHYQHSTRTGISARMFCGQSQGLRVVQSPNHSAVTCTRCLAKLAAPKAPRQPRVEVDSIEYTAEEQARIDALPFVPRR